MPQTLAKQLALAAALCIGCLSSRGEAQALSFYSLAPCRAVDTRTGNGGAVPNGIPPRLFYMKNECGVPSDAQVVTLNVTAILPTCDGFFVLYPAGGSFPPVSNINFLAGETALGNGAVVPIAATNPDLSFAYGVAVGPCTTNVTIDVTGYFK